MKTSANGIAFIEAREGVVLKAYYDQVCILTVGVGHKVLPGDDIVHDQVISQARADSLLTGDLATAEAAVNGSIKAKLTQNQFDALVSLTFNIGDNAEIHSTLVKEINTSQSADVIKAWWLVWDHAAGRVLPALESRRQLEIALYFTA